MAMIPKEVHARYDKLKASINHYRTLYHVYDTEELSEAALDSLKHELTRIEEKYPEIIASDSPSQRVAGQQAHNGSATEDGEIRLGSGQQ